MANEAERGKAALERGDYPEALHYYSKALQTSPSPAWYIQRSIAHHRNGNKELALADADNAVVAAVSRGRREFIATGQFRRGVALHGLRRFGDARLCLHWANKYNDKEKGLTMWVAKVKSDYEKAGGDGAECNKITVKEIPDKVDEAAVKAITREPPSTNKKDGSSKGTGKAVEKEDAAPRDIKGKAKAVENALPSRAASAQTPKDKVRHEWYQSPSTVTIEIFVRGVTEDKVTVDISEGSLEVNFPLEASHSTYDYTVTPLFAKIDPAKSSSRKTAHKIEIVLAKSVPGVKWSSLEGSEPIISSEPTGPTSKIPEPVLKELARSQAKAPAYPTSSRSGPKNWDTVVGDEKDEEEDDGPDAFFKKLYKNADPDVKRAMMKSYQESNGTALSTNWSDVGKRKVDTVPPEGVEAKNWES